MSLKKVSIFNVILLLTLIIFTVTSLDTHKKITYNGPNMHIININQKDNLQVKVFGVDGQYQIFLQNQLVNISIAKSSICFMNQICSLQYTSQKQFQALIYVGIKAYKYSYEILINNKTIQSHINIRTSFLGQKFIYSKYLQPSTYTIKIFYKHATILNASFIFMRKPHIIYANNVTQIQINLNHSLPIYQLQFDLPKQFLYLLWKQQIQVQIQLPNQMLKGCNTKNYYDIITRTCPLKQYKYQDSIIIHKLGYYPQFQLNQFHKVTIKIAILQFTKWRQLFSNQNLTLYLTNSSNSRIFNGLTKQQINSRFRTKEVCNFKISVCTFIFKLQAGNYTVMPLFSGETGVPFVYLFQRSDESSLLQAFYSVLPITSASKTQEISGIMMQFQTLKQNLVQVIIECGEQITVLQYQIFHRSNITGQDGQYMIQPYQINIEQQFSQNLNAVSLIGQLQPNSAYLLFVNIISREKFKQYFKSQQKVQDNQNPDNQEIDQDEDEDLIREQEQEEDGQQIAHNEQQQQIQPSKQPVSLSLNTQILQIKINNGRFPHKKVIQPRLSEQIQEQSFIQQHMVHIVLAVVAISIGGYFYIKNKICKKAQTNIQQLQLVSQKTVSDKIGSSTFQISSISKTQNQS